MKKLLCLLFLLGFCFYGYAELYVIVDNNTKEVYSASEKNDTVLPEGKSLLILEGNWNNYEFDEALTNYKYIDGKFIKNIAKINEEYQSNLESLEIQNELKMINDKIQEMAIDELEKEGKVIKHFKKEK